MQKLLWKSLYEMSYMVFRSMFSSELNFTNTTALLNSANIKFVILGSIMSPFHQIPIFVTYLFKNT
jgi:hypothetical protein